MPNYGQAVLEFSQRGARSGFAPPDFPLQFAAALDVVLVVGAALGFQLTEFPLQVSDLLHRPLDLLSELLPLEQYKRNLADRLEVSTFARASFQTASCGAACLPPTSAPACRPIEPASCGNRQRLRTIVGFRSFAWCPPWCPLRRRRDPQRSQGLGALPDLFRQFHDSKLDKSGAADSLLHPKLAPFHAACKIHFAFTG